jgi:hypothetical protein
MTYDMALEYEQEREYHEHRRLQSKRRPVRFGQGQLCKCGLMIAEDCNCHPF